jgi:hypothetical protein
MSSIGLAAKGVFALWVLVSASSLLLWFGGGDVVAGKFWDPCQLLGYVEKRWWKAVVRWAHQ